MKLTYPADTIDAARALAGAHGHTITGRFTRVRSGLSWENHCRQCNWPVVVVPHWTPWQRDEMFGDAVRMSCPAGKGARP